jgi:hypothetical protein
MYDFNEQQGEGQNPKPDHKDGADKSKSSSCGGSSSHSSHSSHSSSQGWDDDCGCGSTPSTYSGDVVYSRLPEKTDSESETVFAEQDSSSAGESSLSPEQREELFDGLVRSQQPDPDASSSSSSAETVAQNPQNPMQWTLVDLNSSCDKPGCDPEACDSEDCDTTEEYDRSEYEYAGAGGDRDPALTFASNDAKEYAFSELPPAPAPFVPGESQKLEGGAAKAKKAAKAKEPKKAAAKKAKTTKAGAKKTATKAKAKKGAKKTATKAASKKGAKKPAAAKSKKAAATDPSHPVPLNDPHFPREQAA